MKKKGFTLVELLVVIAIIALLMGILMPALARVRQLAFRMTCGTNLSGIGKAMLIYANDYDDELPKAGGRSNTWVNKLPNWSTARTRREAFGLDASSNNGSVTVSSSMYLLVLHAEVTPKSFVCKGESDTREFTIADWVGKDSLTAEHELEDIWDFGGWQGPDREQQADHVSYAYQVPFGAYALTVAHEPTMTVAADRSPWFTPGTDPHERWGGDGTDENPAFEPDIEGFDGTAESGKKGNSLAHQNEGQNVLFLDSHVEFAKRAWVGTDLDNIYTKQASPDSALTNRVMGLGVPQRTVAYYNSLESRQDSVLIQEPGPSR